ncbi:MAG: T9SS type A sorting domain-containing protein [Bacteroidota bacterium]
MKTILFSLLILCSYPLSAQIRFVESPQTVLPFEGVGAGSVSFADIDADGDQDLFITGQNDSLIHIARLYQNDGQGRFAELTTSSFVGVSGSSAAFSDVDGDGDQDLILSGLSPSIAGITKLYINDGQGIFSEDVNTIFLDAFSSSLAFSDVDGDGDEDVLITGQSNFGDNSKLYKNDGQGVFTEDKVAPFWGVVNGSVAFADVDADGDQDLIITGRSLGNNIFIAKLYINDRVLDRFLEDRGVPFEGVGNGAIAFSDVDGDGDQDLVLTGKTNASIRIAKLYENDGLGVFTEVQGTPFIGVDNSTVAFADLDRDGDEDLIISGDNGTNIPITKLYKNGGQGNFTEVLALPFLGVDFGDLAFADVDSDGDQDLFLSGRDSSANLVSKLYLNESWAVGLGNTFETFEFIQFPNPVGKGTQDISLRFTSTKASVLNVQLLDVMGRQLIQKTERIFPGEQELALDVSGLPKGNYIILLEDGERRGTQKLILR